MAAGFEDIPVSEYIEPGTYTLSGCVYYVDQECAWFTPQPSGICLSGDNFRNVVTSYLEALSGPSTTPL